MRGREACSTLVGARPGELKSACQKQRADVLPCKVKEKRTIRLLACLCSAFLKNDLPP